MEFENGNCLLLLFSPELPRLHLEQQPRRLIRCIQKVLCCGESKKEAPELPVVVGSIARMPVPTVNPSTSVTRIASIMAKRDIGAVIVTRDSEVLGIVTERDIISRVALAKRDLYGFVAQDIMTAPVITIHYERTLEEALEIMRKNRIRRLVVVKDGSIFGLVTERRVLLANFAGHAETKGKSQT